MRVHGVQWDLLWHDKAGNFDRARELVGQAAIEAGDLIALPEMFATGYTMDLDAAAEDAHAPASERFLAELARDTGAAVLGGVVRRDPDSGRGLNQAVTFAPDGREIARYTKMHPLTIAGEADAYVPGEREMTFKLDELTVAPLVCYDLRFPERFRAALAACPAGSEGRVDPVACPHLFVVIASWPAARAKHWTVLLRARAIENQAYLLGVNRTGHDPNHAYAGGSVVIAPTGETLADAGHEAAVASAAIDLQSLFRFRETFPALSDIR